MTHEPKATMRRPAIPANENPVSKIAAPLTRAAQKSRTRERLIDAAVDVFYAEGYTAATIEQIAARAGTSRPTFYAHFKSKADVANQIGPRITPHMKALFAELDRFERPSLMDVRQWMDRLVEFWDVHQVAIEASTEAVSVDSEQASNYVDLMTETCYLYMPNYLARFEEGEARQRAHMRLLLLKLQQERLFFITQVRGARFKYANELDALAEIWWLVLFNEPS